MRRLAAGGIAGLGWFSLGLRLYLSIEVALVNGVPVDSVLVAYFGFFTILTNLLIAVCLTLAALDPDPARLWNRPPVQAALALYIIIVAVVYAVVLQRLYNPQGLALVADRLLHRALPALYVAYWLLLTPKGLLNLADPVRWQIYPLAYLTYTLARGAETGSYPYPFLNVTRYGYVDVFWNAFLILALLLTLGLLLVILDRWLGSRQGVQRRAGRPQRTGS